MNTAVIINGQGGSGKDTFVNFVMDLSPIPVFNFSSVDRIKEAANLLGWSGTKEENDRKFLSELKQLSVWYNDFPTKDLVDSYNDYSIEVANDCIFFFHVREPDQIDKLKKSLLDCENPPKIFTMIVQRGKYKKFNNKSDDSIQDYNYDIQVGNDGELEELKKAADHILEYIGVKCESRDT